MDILLSLNPVNLDVSQEEREDSKAIRERVAKARVKQYERYQSEVTNGNVSFEVLTALSPLNDNQRKMIRQMASKQQWSNRVQIKIIRLARTISDLAGDKGITDESIWKAMTMRRLNPHKEHLKVRKQ